MKYNPMLNESGPLAGFAGLHPLTPGASGAGALELMARLEAALGRDHRHGRGVAPSGGRRARRAHRAADDPRATIATQRRAHKVIIPDTAHGTNPASCALAGYRGRGRRSRTRAASLEVGRARAGSQRRRRRADGHEPEHARNLRDRDRRDRRRSLHERGALLYCDGANMNALLGVARPGRHGHRHHAVQSAQNLLHSARRRRSGRGSGRGEEASRAVSAPAAPATGRRGLEFSTMTVPTRSGGVADFTATSACWSRACAFILALGGDGLTRGEPLRDPERQLRAQAPRAALSELPY